MRKLYVKLAVVNIRNNRQLYLPYLLAGGVLGSDVLSGNVHSG